MDQSRRQQRDLTSRRAMAMSVAALFLSVFSGCAGCIERLAPGQVAAGVGRLTVRHAGAIAALVEADTTCGFSSERVLRGAFIQGLPGQQGAVTLTVENCVIDFPEKHGLGPDCRGVETSVKGKITVSATKRISGTVTGDLKRPVIPAAADAVSITVDSESSNFAVTKSDSTAALTTISGKLHFALAPRVALSKSLGVCALTTLDVTVTDIRYQEAQVLVIDGSHIFPVDVPSSNYFAQVGKWHDDENNFKGQMTVWDALIDLPLPDDAALDEAYTPESYLASISCKPDLVTPVNYSCPSPREQVVHGAARLSVSHFGAIASLIQADTRCGFSSPSVLAHARLSGSTGGLGSAVLTLQAPCVLAFPADTPISTNCLGVVKSASGVVTVTGSMTLTGVLTGDTAQPVVPNGRDPAQMALTAEFGDFKVWDANSEQYMTARSGTLSGTIRPRVALDSRIGVCTNSTSVAQFSNLEWHSAQLEVFNQGLTFLANVSGGALEAQSGTNGERTNYLSGSMVADGIPIAIPPLGSMPILDPSYDASTFEATYSCRPGFATATDDAACSVFRAMGINAARLILKIAGTIGGQVQTDTRCGFSANTVKINPSVVRGAVGEMGSIEWEVQHCSVGQEGVSMSEPTCDGARTAQSGFAEVTAQRIVTGERHSEYVFFDSIIPRARDAMTINLREVDLTNYFAYRIPAGAIDPLGKLTLFSGKLSGLVKPSLAERKSTPGVFDVGTPVVTFNGIQLTDARAELVIGAKHFTLVIPTAQLSATHGSVDGRSNTFSGTMVVNSSTISIPEGTTLDPEFDQKKFDDGYACTADLAAVIPPR